MIPHIIHYCWIGGASLPPLAEQCLASWKEQMSDWQIMRWDETTLTHTLSKKPIPSPCPKGKGEEPTSDKVLRTTIGSPIEQSSSPVKGREMGWLDYMPTYVKQAYEARKFAFVSDYVRLWALEQYGGLYMDVDFMVFRSFEDLMDKYAAFAGVEGCKRQAVMMGVIASEPHGVWVKDMLGTYNDRKFILPDGRLDLTPNTSYFSDRLESQGYIPDGKEKDVYVKGAFFLHVMPVWAFCPVLTTGEDVRNKMTYCEHKGLRSWNTTVTWKDKVLKYVSPQMKTRIINLKRKIFG